MGCCGDDKEDKYEEREDEDEPSDRQKEEARTKGGEPMKFDPDFKGPIDNRSCTDVICCLLYIVCFLGFIAVGIFSYVHGDPRLLLYPTDSDGNLCGYGDFEDRPFLFFFDLLECTNVGAAVTVMGCPTPQICVEECPDKNWEWLSIFTEEEGTLDKNYDERRKMLCKYSVTNDTRYSKSIRRLVQDEDCAAYYLESTSLAGRCIPTFIADSLDSIEDNAELLQDRFEDVIEADNLEEGTKYLAILLNAKEYGMKVYQDVRASWWMIMIGLVLAMVWCFVWIFLMRWLAGFMVWLTIVLFIAVFAAATIYCIYKYREVEDLPENTGTVEFTTNLDYYLNLTYTWLALGCLAGLILIIVVLLIIFLRKRILISVALIKEASRAVGHMTLALFWPLIPWILQIFLFTYWGASAIYLASMGDEKGSFVDRNETRIDGDLVRTEIEELSERVPCEPGMNTTGGEICNFLKYGGDEYTVYLQFYQLFMLFWTANFIVALGQMTLAGAFASYYWVLDKNDMPRLPLGSSFYRTIRYHFGTLAFGSLLIAIVQLIRVILEYMDQKLKGTENKVAKWLLKCLKCCFWCLEKFLKFLNKNAYIMTAIYGYNFCKSAAVAFKLILRNIIRVAVVDKVTDFIVFIGKLVVVGVVCFLAFLFFSGELASSVPVDSISDYISEYTPELNYYLIPVIIIGLGTYVIASGFFSVYSMGVDTLFLCFLQDIEVNEGSTEKPYYMSKELMKILGKKNDPAVREALKNKNK